MTKRDFEKLAAAMVESCPVTFSEEGTEPKPFRHDPWPRLAQWRSDCVQIGIMLTKSYPRFDVMRFYRACGVDKCGVTR